MSHELNPLRAHDTPTCVARVKSERGFDGLDRLVVDVMAQLQRSPSPPAVGRNAELRRIVQPPARRTTANCGRLM